MKISYLNKRDENSRLLQFKAYELNYKIAKEAAKILADEDFFEYDEIISNRKLVQVYFEKILFYNFISLSNQITIIQHDKIYKKKILYSSLYICDELFNNALQNLGLKFRVRNKVTPTIKQFFKNKLIFFSENIIKKLSCTLLDSKKVNYNKQDVNIGINYSDGIVKNRRSDLFFLKDSDNLKENVFLYFEYPGIKKKHLELEKIEALIQEYGIKSIDLWKWKQNKIFYDISLIKRKIKNPIEKWVFDEIINLIRQINFWQNFFLDHNLKIHLDPSEYGNSTIIKQIALEKLNGISIGKQRSYPSNIKGSFFHFYPNDIFFTWGEDSNNKLQKTENYIKQFLMSGYPYPINKNYSENYIQNNFNNKVKFKILLIDNGHSFNEEEGVGQNIFTNDLYNFYNKFFELASNDPEVGLIIKCKRYSDFMKLKNIHKIAKKLEDQKQCVIIKDPFQLSTIDVAQIADLSVGISIFHPSAFFETLLSCNGIYFDYSNILSNDNFFNQGKGELFFNKLEILIEKILSYKKNNFEDKEYINWSKFIYKIDYFRDGSGYIRIGEFISNLKKNLDKNLTSKKSIDNATYDYKNKWYKDNNLND